ncbi:DNA repair protein RecO [Thermincola ferriacetica]|uniref:DNA repair protein RecO n=1 Tax=Thermincola ferriacetica TaxID=281456 RepID=A0A0L6VYF8_9FIRM|nr:DNA repair protein RecO [Thermincola ferriacetica]KNZ68246.1 DNA repair protein RecO [Thermincola ferriacetica]
MMRLYKTDALVLRVRDFSEADRIVTLYTYSRGKVQAIAKGSRKTKSRKRGAVQPFTYGNFLLYQGRSLDTITQCEPKESFSHLREDLVKLAYSTYLTELVDGFTAEGEPNEQVFLLLLTTFYLLLKDNPGLLVRAFELKLLNILGYCPQLESCVHCHGPVAGNAAKVRFSSRLGGVLCDECSGHDPFATTIQMGSLKTMQQLLKWDIRRLQVLKVPEERQQEIAAILRHYIDERIERKLKSTVFLDTVLQ